MGFSGPFLGKWGEDDKVEVLGWLILCFFASERRGEDNRKRKKRMAKAIGEYATVMRGREWLASFLKKLSREFISFG